MTAFQGKERCSTLIEVRAIVIQDTEGARSLTYGTSALHGWQELNGTMATISQSGGQHILILFQNSHLRNGGGISAGRNRPLVQAHGAIRSCHNPKSFFVCRLCELTNSFCSSAIRFLALILPPLLHLSHTSPTPLYPTTSNDRSYEVLFLYRVQQSRSRSHHLCCTLPICCRSFLSLYPLTLPAFPTPGS